MSGSAARHVAKSLCPHRKRGSAFSKTDEHGAGMGDGVALPA